MTDEPKRPTDPVMAKMHEGKTCADIARETGMEASEVHRYVVAFWKADKEQKGRW